MKPQDYTRLTQRSSTTNKNFVKKTKFYGFVVQIFIFLLLYSFLFAEDLFIYDSHGKKDPFNPPIIGAVEKTGEEVLKGVKLEGIIWDEKKPMAIINNKVVGVGDDISGAKIIEIKKNEVIFNFDSQTIKVRLGKEVEE